ncbi:1-phosphofructokinase family hexose kinase [Vreelandella rituensis]|uniref:Phosphofructokinase n=1 Tax=Vreelandella rituensis TaxID=2282306 RepID=A0A368TN44_9GAMM|nr:1-phosphofructokinase family hexose kinase [Halomonas rituensis]RCV85968.1 1-phosphofructokinase family hexose kinase [Halomonas rituensis]
MGNVATVTMNPTVDLFAETGELVENGKTRCRNIAHEPGGGGINVARNLHRFGVDVVAILTAGGLQGELLKRLLAREKFSVHCVDIEDETRQSLAVTEKASGKLFHLVFPGPELQESEWQRCLDTFKALKPAPDYLVLSGSLPGGVPDDFYGNLARSAVDGGTRVILDTSGKALPPSGGKGIYLTKLNFREFVDLGYSGPEDYSSILGSMGQMVNQGLADNLIVTLDADGALLASSAGEKLHARPPETRVISHVGAGDSFVSALVYQLDCGKTVAEAFPYGVAAAAAKVSTPGNQLMDLEKVESIVAKVTIRIK